MIITSLSSISNVNEDAQLLDSIERWTMRELKPIVREYDHEDRYPEVVVEQMKELELFGATVSEEYGICPSCT
jgi:alkylation response protein AidB-like acyl-CoA dehydrogenase